MWLLRFGSGTSTTMYSTMYRCFPLLQKGRRNRLQGRAQPAWRQMCHLRYMGGTLELISLPGYGAFGSTGAVLIYGKNLLIGIEHTVVIGSDYKGQ